MFHLPQIPLPILIGIVALAIFIVWAWNQGKHLEHCKECGKELYFWGTKKSECRNPRCPLYKQPE